MVTHFRGSLGRVVLTPAAGSATAPALPEGPEVSVRELGSDDDATFIENTKADVTPGNHDTVTSKTFTDASTGGKRG
ncbi:hypothetical protein OG259_16590 [Streptomyces sp. NBC_00250]|uniref:hypothetical protein n=1 Tax=Streptomyces sp. NBC_00250 TaxID=2903641 RepID=UPI002E2AA74E|nr:hypothetical protein [Streptomyces sp. NBC_00250]